MKKYLFLLLSTTFLSLVPRVIHAQTYTPSDRTPQPDNSIGTIVDSVGANFNITGGLRRGQNLFHSFTDFSIPTNGAANFANPQGNQSIITRVTGNLFSDINGTLNTNGTNFLLINPNGVVFGPGVSLNVGKAFVTSTASGVDFVDAQGVNYNFGVNKAGDTPFISIDPNVAFSPARLIMNARISGSNGIVNYGTLQTSNPGQYIGLIGGNVTLIGKPSFTGGSSEGEIFSAGGRIDIGGLKSEGTVTTDDKGLVFEGNGLIRSDVVLVNRAFIGVSADLRVDADYQDSKSRVGVGRPLEKVNTFFNNVNSLPNSITIKANRVLLDNSQISSNFSASELNNIPLGGISIDTTGRFLLIRSLLRNSVTSLSKVDSGGIKIEANGLDILDKSGIDTDAIGKSNSGDIKVESRGKILIDNSKIATTTLEKGNSGNIFINSNDLDIRNNGNINTSVNGSGGSSILLKDGTYLLKSYISTGNAGSIDLKTNGNINIDGGEISTLTGQSGQGGNIFVESKGNLSILKNASINSLTLGQGDAGDINIRVYGNAIVSGNNSRREVSKTISPPLITQTGANNINYDFDKAPPVKYIIDNIDSSSYAGGRAGKINLEVGGDLSINQRMRISSKTLLSGDAGDIDIRAKSVSITDDSGISSSSFGQGKAANITIRTQKLNLNNGDISTNAQSVTGGDINLNINDQLLMRNNSQINTNSGSRDQNGNGGNIAIYSPLIIATPSNNDITANANGGNGGRVNITSQGLFGIQFRPTGSLLTNDITASSTFGQSGSVQINTPGIDPGKDTGELPAAPNDASNQISQACSASQRENKFYITGRGGLPPNASEPQESEALWQDAREVKTKPATTATQASKFVPPAIGWVFQKDGRVRLIAAQTGGEVTGAKVVCPSK